MLKRIISAFCLTALLLNPLAFTAVKADPSYLLNESFDGSFSPAAENGNLLLGGSILSVNSYRDNVNNKSYNCIASDGVKTNYLKQSLQSGDATNWRGVYLSLNSAPTGQYQILEFDYKLSRNSNGLWVQICDDRVANGTNADNKFAMFSITKERLAVRSTSSTYKNFYLSDYGFPSDLSVTENWHSIKLILDTSRYVYDILLDGVIVAADVPSSSNLSGVGFQPKRVYFSAQGTTAGSYIGLDDVKMYEVTAEEANNIAAAGFDKLFANVEIYTDTLALPFAGAQGKWGIEGTPTVSYSSTDSSHVTIVDTHWTTKVGESKLTFSDMPGDGDPDVDFTLNVTVTRPEGSSSAVKSLSYPLKLSYMTPQKQVERDAALMQRWELTGGNPDALTEDLTLPDTGRNGSAVSWSSSDTAAVSNEGVVTRGSTDTAVTMTATFTQGAASTTKDFVFTVKQSAKALMEADEAAWSKPDFSGITADFSLPLTGSVNGSTITWHSDNAAVFIRSGEAAVTRPEYDEGDAAVTLTATYTLDFETLVFTYPVTVLKQDSGSGDPGFVISEYALNESFDGSFTEDSQNSNLVLGGSIHDYYNYRDGRANKLKTTIESDDVKTNYLKQVLLSDESISNWRGVYLDVERTPRTQYQILDFDFKMSGGSGNGIWVQVCDTAGGTAGGNAGNKSVIFSITNSGSTTKMYYRNTGSNYANFNLNNYGLEQNFSAVGAWHNVKLIMDTTRYVYDILVDGVIVVADAPASSEMPEEYLVKRIYLSAQGTKSGEYACFDDVKLYEVTAEQANTIARQGFDNLFANKEIYTSSMLLPNAGGHGAFAVNGEPTVSYSTDSADNVKITDTHYSGAAGTTRLDFTGVPTSASVSAVDVNLFIRMERPTADGESAVEAFSYPLKLSYLSDQKRVELDASFVQYTSLTAGNRKLLKGDLTLPSGGRNGSKISWSSSNTGVISNSGVVTRADVNENVALTATFSYGSAQFPKTFQFTVKASAKGLMEADEAAWSKPAFSGLTESFAIPLTGTVNGSEITWTSDSAALFIQGSKVLVTRPVYENGDVNATLKATYTLDSETVVFTYPVTVKKLPSDAECVDAAYDALTFSSLSQENESSISRNLSLKTDLGSGVSCVWTSTDETVIKTDGTVINPALGQGSAQVTLTAAISKGEATRTKSFNVTVLGFTSAEELVARAKTALTFSQLSTEPIQKVTKNLVLPSEGSYGTSIAWRSTKPTVLLPGSDAAGGVGVVVRPEFGQGAASVTLTAVISYGSVSTEKQFLINVLENDGYEEVFAMNCEQENDIIGGAPAFTGIGKTLFHNSDRGTHTVVLNPNSDSVNSGSKVAKFTRNDDVKLVCRMSYLTTYGNQRFSTDELTVKTKICIPSGTQNVVRCSIRSYDDLSGGQVIWMPVDFQPDGSVIVKYSQSGAEVDLHALSFTYEHDKWMEVEFRGNTYTRLCDLYIDGVKINGSGKMAINGTTPYDTSAGIPAYYYYDTDQPSNFYALSFSHEASSMTGGTVYIDDVSVKRKVSYEEDLKRAMSEFDLQFLGNNATQTIYKDLVYPTVTVPGVTIAYFSDDQSVVTNAGKVFVGDTAKDVTLLVSFSDSNNVTSYKSYSLRVVAKNDPAFVDKMTDSERVAYDLADAISSLSSNYNLNHITGNLSFASKGAKGSDMTYVSSAPSLVSDSGVVTAGSTDASAVITITASYNGESAAGSITVTVKAVTPGGSPGGGTPGSISAGSGNVAAVSGGQTASAPDGNTESSGIFGDVPVSFWAYKEIAALKARRIVDGVGDNLFDVNGTVKREEVIKMLISVLGLETAAMDRAFSDVDENAWYYPYISTAVSLGLMNGYDNGLAGIGDSITREELAVFIYNAVKDREGFIDTSDGESFADHAGISDYALKAVYALKANGLMFGRENNAFEPKAYVTRAEAAVMIYRIMQ